MKWTLLAIFLFTSACSTKGINTTLFLKEDDSRFYNIKDEDCLESGYQIKKHTKFKDKWVIITSYENCAIHKERVLKDFEPKQWLIKEPKMKESFK